MTPEVSPSCQKVTLPTKRWHCEIFLKTSKERKFLRDTEVGKNFPKVSPSRWKIQIFSYTILKGHTGVKRWHFEQKGDTLKFSLKFQKNENFIGILRWIKFPKGVTFSTKNTNFQLLYNFKRFVSKGDTSNKKVTLWQFP